MGATLQEFIDYLEEQVRNHSIYIWGAQGQGYPTVSEAWIKTKESGIHQTNALKTYRKAVAAGCEKTLRAFDCSGLGAYWLQNLKGVIPSDKNANGLMGMCTLIQKNHVKKGDFVFKRYTTGTKRAYHIGYVVDDDLNVIEAQGRAYGVVKRKLSAGGWNEFGRPKFFADEIDTQEERIEHASFNRILRKGCKGDDVKYLQLLLNEYGDDLKEDGDFGAKTYNAVKDFQRKNRLKVDGIAGKNTITALGGAWYETVVWSVSRNLRKGYKGSDVKSLQTALIAQGFACGSTGADGEFGANTEKAVKALQQAKGLTVDGIAGKNTITALGGKWAA